MKGIDETAVLLDEPIKTEDVLLNYQKQLYIPGYWAVQTANRIFGYDGWSYSLKGVKDIGGGIWEAVVTVTVNFDGTLVSREDVGICIAAINNATNEIARESHETAIKGAVTDALKRALRTFGEQFGNSLYDKEEIERIKKEMAQVARQSYAQPQPAQNRAAAPYNAAPARQSPPVQAPTAQNDGSGKTPKSDFRLRGEAGSEVDLTDVPAAPPPVCPKCHKSEMWDNVAGKFWGTGLGSSGNPKPVFSCKDKQGCGKSIWATDYQNGQLPDEYYPTPADNPKNAGGSPPPPLPQPEGPPLDMSEMASEAQMADLKKLAEAFFEGNWEDVLKDTSMDIAGHEDYHLLRPNEAEGVKEAMKNAFAAAA